MNRNKLKHYAPQARRDFIAAVTDRAAYYGMTTDKIEPITAQGDVALIGGKPFPRSVAAKRKRLEERVHCQAFEQVMEAMAYTWFNRFVAVRYMELHGYLDHGYRVLSHPEAKSTPEIVEHAEHVDLPGLDTEKVVELKLEGTKEAELYRMLLIAQCNALHSAMPFLFARIDDETELLLPDNLLHSDSLIRKLVNAIDEEEWQEVEIIGWLYQFYISEKKDEVIGKVVKSEDIPAATQLFTPNWIVKYLVQNTLGRKWMATYPDSRLKEQMEYYIEPAEQMPEVQAQLKECTPDSLNPEELTLLDPACGSGHILVEAYDVLKAIYQERGYRAKDIPQLILQKNLFGLEIDDRAAQLAAFALMMKAREDDRRIFDSGVQPHVLAIQESKGLEAKEITEALNAPLESDGTTGDIAQADITHLFDLFAHGKTFGSLVRVPDSLAKKTIAIAKRIRAVCTEGSMFAKSSARRILPLIEQTGLLTKQYDAVVANPPYMGNLFATLTMFAKSQYPNSKADLFAMFIERGLLFAKHAGHNAMVTMHSWMFLSTYAKLRQWILHNYTIESMAHLGPRAFGAISGEVVQVTAFVLRKMPLTEFRPTFFGLVDGNEEAKRQALATSEHCFTDIQQSDFEVIPGSPIAYWATPAICEAFQKGIPLAKIAEPRVGLQTGDNDRFLRRWYEVDIRRVGFGMTSREEAKASGKKWFPYNKGGEFRKWYGNQEWVVNWHDDGKSIRSFGMEDQGRPRSRAQNTDYYFKKCLSWSKVTSGNFAVRIFDYGFIFDVAGCSIFPNDGRFIYVLAAILNSKLMIPLLGKLAQTLNFEVGQIATVPILSHFEEYVGISSEIVSECIELSKLDWDSFETSWGFEYLPFTKHELLASTVETSFSNWYAQCYDNIHRMHELEEKSNQLFIRAYGLQDELTPNVPEEHITLARPDRGEDIKRLLSYAIGCMMGRYSLDKPSLIYALSGNRGFDPSQYKTFPADQDGIVPITDIGWFPDDATNRVVEFIRVTWPQESIEKHLKFVAESLGAQKGEHSQDTIRRYLAQEFFKDHLRWYKKRPIYWLFSSGKHRAFQCLVYLHRYHEGTLSRMRTEYVIPLQGKIASRIDQLDDDIAAASSTSHRKKLEKERDLLVKQQTELQRFDEKLRHYADRRISLDLDDGVKVNYGKFGDLLAEVKTVTGQNAE